MSVLIFSSTPRREGNSDILADEAFAGVQEATRLGGADRADGATRADGSEVDESERDLPSVWKIRLADLHVKPCTACDSCLKALDTECVIHDDALEPLRMMRNVAGVIFCSPIYCFAVSAQLKLFIDRTYSLFSRDHWDTLAGVRFGAIFTYGDEDSAKSGVRNAIGMVEDAVGFWKGTLVGVVEASCSEAGAVRNNPDALKAARTLGARVASG